MTTTTKILLGGVALSVALLAAVGCVKLAPAVINSIGLTTEGEQVSPPTGPLSPWQQSVKAAGPAAPSDRRTMAAQLDELGDVVREDAGVATPKLYFAKDLLDKFDEYSLRKPAAGIDPEWDAAAAACLALVRAELASRCGLDPSDTRTQITNDHRVKAQQVLHEAGAALRR